jgi:hypothetical protein
VRSYLIEKTKQGIGVDLWNAVKKD